MAAVPTIPVNTAAIAVATAAAKASSYVVPTVDQIYAAGLSLDQVNKSLFFDGVNLLPGAIFPSSFGDEDLYYNLSYLWPQLNVTGIVLTDRPTYCTPQICSLLLGIFLYLPNIPANIFYAVMFGLAMLVNMYFGIRHRTWGYMIGMMLGLLCEVIGYAGRVLLSLNDFSITPFYLYIICLTIGPAFLSFSIYTCLARIIVVCGSDLSRLKPKTYTYIFATSDFLSLVLQGGGGGIAATANDPDTSQKGINIMIAGLALQVASLTVFIAICVELALRIRRHHDEKEPAYELFRRSKRFRAFLYALGVATITIYIRSVFRVAELKQGFQSRFANNETTFMVLEGAMILIATIALTALHLGLVFGSLWREVSLQMRGKGIAAQ